MNCKMFVYHRRHGNKHITVSSATTTIPITHRAQTEHCRLRLDMTPRHHTLYFQQKIYQTIRCSSSNNIHELLRPVYSDTTQLNSTSNRVASEKCLATPTQLNLTSSCRHVHNVNNCHRSVLNVVTRWGCLQRRNLTQLDVELRRYKRAFSNHTHKCNTLLFSQKCTNNVVALLEHQWCYTMNYTHFHSVTGQISSFRQKYYFKLYKYRYTVWPQKTKANYFFSIVSSNRN